jgi:hypothetical protein
MNVSGLRSWKATFRIVISSAVAVGVLKRAVMRSYGRDTDEWFWIMRIYRRRPTHMSDFISLVTKKKVEWYQPRVIDVFITSSLSKKKKKQRNVHVTKY